MFHLYLLVTKMEICGFRGQATQPAFSTVAEVRLGCVGSKTGWVTFKINGQKQLNLPSFTRDVKLGGLIFGCGTHSRPELAEKLYMPS